MLHPEFQTKLPVVTKLLSESKVRNAYVFGSVLTERFNEESDIDILINFEKGIDPLVEGRIWWNLHDSLRDIFNRDVDILVEENLRNPYFIEELNEKKQLIYAK